MAEQERHHVAARANSDLTVVLPVRVHRSLTALQRAHAVPLTDRASSPATRASALIIGTADILDVLANSAGLNPNPCFAELAVTLLPGQQPERVRTDLGQPLGELAWTTTELLSFIYSVVAELVNLHG